jgi:hypothetical protein
MLISVNVSNLFRSWHKSYSKKITLLVQRCPKSDSLKLKKNGIKWYFFIYMKLQGTLLSGSVHHSENYIPVKYRTKSGNLKFETKWTEWDILK